MKSLELSRRSFLGRAGAVLAGVAALNAGPLALAGCGGETSPAVEPSQTGDAPKALAWNTVITSKDEPGRPLLVTGRVYGPDGKTPLAGVTLYVYHTDDRGLYPGDGISPPPRLRGWMKTDREGRYEFRTVKPASYPDSSNPEHVHAKIAEAGHAERGIGNFWFDDDPLVTPEMRARLARPDSFSPIMRVTRDADGLLRCVRDIRLERA